MIFIHLQYQSSVLFRGMYKVARHMVHSLIYTAEYGIDIFSRYPIVIFQELTGKVYYGI